MLRPCIVAGPGRAGADRAGCPRGASRVRCAARCRRCCPIRACRSSSSTTTTSRARSSPPRAARAMPGAYNLAGEGTITMADFAHALGWHSIPVPRALVGAAALGAGLPLMPPIAQWVNAGRVPVVMDTGRARRELRWRPKPRHARDAARARRGGARARAALAEQVECRPDDRLGVDLVVLVEVGDVARLAEARTPRQAMGARRAGRNGQRVRVAVDERDERDARAEAGARGSGVGVPEARAGLEASGRAGRGSSGRRPRRRARRRRRACPRRAIASGTSAPIAASVTPGASWPRSR